LVLASVAAAGCTCSRYGGRDGGIDAGIVDPNDALAPDGGPADARDDARIDIDARIPVDAGRDAARDAGRADAGRDATADARDADARDADARDADAGDADAGDADAGDADAGDAGDADAGDADAGDADATAGTILECAPAIDPNESMSGMVLSTDVWVGFRFQVPAGGTRTLTRVELNMHPGVSTSETVFAAIVALTGPGDIPDSYDLTSPDVLTRVLMTFPPGPTRSATVSTPVGLPVAPGWYAAVFGTGAFFASLSMGTVHTNGGTGPCLDGNHPFSMLRRTSTFVLQAQSPHMLVELAP
jgi:hypothetical protein